MSENYPGSDSGDRTPDRTDATPPAPGNAAERPSADEDQDPSAIETFEEEGAGIAPKE